MVLEENAANIIIIINNNIILQVFRVLRVFRVLWVFGFFGFLGSSGISGSLGFPDSFPGFPESRGVVAIDPKKPKSYKNSKARLQVLGIK